MSTAPRPLPRLLPTLLPAGITALALLAGSGLLLGGPSEASTSTTEEPNTDPTPVFEAAPVPSPRLALNTTESGAYTRPITTWFADHPGERGYVQVDRPLYRPGETIWFRSWDLATRTLSTRSAPTSVVLVNPRGGVEATVNLEAGVTSGKFDLAKETPGGAWTLRLVKGGATLTERTIIVRTVQIPKLKTTLEVPPAARNPGDSVEATVHVARATGEVLANHPIQVVLQVDGAQVQVEAVTTDTKGDAVIRFTLPTRIAVGEAMLTVLVTDGGITESTSRAVPIVLQSVRLTAYPEGGQLVVGLADRVYFEVTDPKGKPVEAKGHVEDDTGLSVAPFATSQDGRGIFTLRPAAGRAYRAIVERDGVAPQSFPLPTALSQGCVMRTYADVDGLHPAVRAEVACSEPRTVTVVATQREALLDIARVSTGPDAPAVVYLSAKDEAQVWSPGVARVTVFDGLTPLAERVVFRNRGQQLKVDLKADKTSYAPGDEVRMTVRTRNRNGIAVPAELALGVVDDALLTYADDDAGRLVAQALLAPEVPGTIDAPNHYFDAQNPNSAEAMDLLLGTRGWRRFEWGPVWTWEETKKREALAKAARANAERERMEVRKKAEMDFEDIPMPAAPVPQMAAEGAMEEAKDMLNRVPAGRAYQEVAAASPGKPSPATTTTRVMAAPALADVTMRTDFRDTIYWNPSVRTDASGRATVRFTLSDAVGSFRAAAEGAGGGTVGLGEQLLVTRLPLALDVKLPDAMSQGDEPLLPILVNNDTDAAVKVALQADWAGLLAPRDAGALSLSLAANSRDALYVPLRVVAPMGRGKVTISGRAGDGHDAFARDIEVTPLGFPQERSMSGTVATTYTETLTLPAFLPGTVEASAQVYPSALSTMLSGLDGMLRQPGGCFEQTSSSNYPNVMIMRYLDEQHETAPEIATRATALLTDGYQRLTGFESQGGGYEWFGGAPGHEALTAYGILEFNDMKTVYPKVDVAMIDRTARWLIGSRRNGKGGYLRNPRALDTFGGAPETVTDAYITWTLAEAGYVGDLDPELDAAEALADKTTDPYLLALATGAIARDPARKESTRKAADRLARMQAEDGSWPGAEVSITRSGGKNLLVETTALAVLALLTAEGPDSATTNGVAWLTENRDGSGAWGATQATVLALRAVTTYATTHRATTSPGKLQLVVNGTTVGAVSYTAGQKETMVLPPYGHLLHPGANSVTLNHEGGRPMPFTFSVVYRTEAPLADPDVAVDLETALSTRSLRMGETTHLTATVHNNTTTGQPMTIARIGIPGGLSPQQWQLDALKEQKLIDFYETRPREVAVYWRGLPPSATMNIGLDLVATVPGTYTGPASSAYLYYTDDRKDWSDGVRVEIAR